MLYYEYNIHVSKGQVRFFLYWPVVNRPPKAVFTPDRNMISLIMHETCFVRESGHIRQCIARIMFET